MSFSFLSNINTSLLNITDDLYKINNITETLLQGLPSLQNLSEEEKLTKIHLYNNIQSFVEFKLNYFFLKYANLNISLEIINNFNNINNVALINYFYNKKIDLKFKNYDIYELIKTYNNVISDLYQPVNAHNIFFKTTFSNISMPINTKLIDLLKINKNNDFSNRKTPLIDLYLMNYKNTPESVNNLLNYIFFLRKFPLFKEIIKKYYYEQNQINYKILEEIDLPNLETGFSPLSFSDNNKTIYNISLLIQDNYNIDKFILNIKSVNKKGLLFTFNTINLDYYGLYQDFENNIDIRDINLLSGALDILKYKEHANVIAFVLFLKLVDTNKDFISTNSDENLNILYSNFLINLYLIYIYLNLDSYDNIEDFNDVYKHEEINYLDVRNLELNLKTTYILFFVNCAYFLFKFNKSLYQEIDNRILYIRHLFYVFKHIKTNEPEIFPLFLFLLCSNDKLKIIFEYNYNDNFILDFLVDYYDKIYTNVSKIILKK